MNRFGTIVLLDNPSGKTKIRIASLSLERRTQQEIFELVAARQVEREEARPFEKTKLGHVYGLELPTAGIDLAALSNIGSNVKALKTSSTVKSFVALEIVEPVILRIYHIGPTFKALLKAYDQRRNRHSVLAHIYYKGQHEKLSLDPTERSIFDSDIGECA